MDKEAFGVNRQPYGIVYQCKGYESQQYGQTQQQQTDIADILIDHINQVFLIAHLLHIGILFNLLLYFGYAVRIRIVGMQLHLDGSVQRIISQKVLRVCPHRLNLFMERLLLRNILRRAYKDLLVQLLLQFQYIRLFHIIADDNGEIDILLHIH